MPHDGSLGIARGMQPIIACRYPFIFMFPWLSIDVLFQRTGRPAACGWGSTYAALAAAARSWFRDQGPVRLVDWRV